MKNLAKTLFYCLAISMAACSSDDNEPVKEKEPSARFEVENNTLSPIPDFNAAIPGVKESEVTVETEGIIADASKITVKLDLEHTWAGDLVVQLFAPSGEYCTLIKRLGDQVVGGNRDFQVGNVIAFNSAATMTINEMAIATTASNIPAGVYLPGAGYMVNPESVVLVDMGTFFTGKSIKGKWKLRISDYSLGDIGKLHNWKLEFNTGALQ